MAQLPPVSALPLAVPSAALPAWSSMSAAATGSSTPAERLATTSAPAQAQSTRRERPPPKDLKATLRRSRHRDREKREKMFLLAISHELQAELERLQRARADRLGAKAGPRQLRQQDLPWRAVALLQRQGLELSRRENARLRALWTSQLRLAAQIQQSVAIPRAPGPMNAQRGKVTDAEADMFAALLSGLDDVSRRVGSMLEGVGLGRLEEVPFHRVESRDDRAASSVTMFAECLLMCSSFETTQKLMLKTIETAILEFGGSHVDVGGAFGADLLCMKLRVAAQGPGQGTECVDMFVVLRKYDFAGQSVYAANTLKIGEGALAGIVETELAILSLARSERDANCCFVRRLRVLEMKSRGPPGRPESQGDELLDKFKRLSVTAVENSQQAAIRTVEGR